MANQARLWAQSTVMSAVAAENRNAEMRHCGGGGDLNIIKKATLYNQISRDCVPQRMRGIIFSDIRAIRRVGKRPLHLIARPALEQVGHEDLSLHDGVHGPELPDARPEEVLPPVCAAQPLDVRAGTGVNGSAPSFRAQRNELRPLLEASVLLFHESLILNAVHQRLEDITIGLPLLLELL